MENKEDRKKGEQNCDSVLTQTSRSKNIPVYLKVLLRRVTTTTTKTTTAPGDISPVKRNTDENSQLLLLIKHLQHLMLMLLTTNLNSI